MVTNPSSHDSHNKRGSILINHVANYPVAVDELISPLENGGFIKTGGCVSEQCLGQFGSSIKAGRLSQKGMPILT